MSSPPSIPDATPAVVGGRLTDLLIRHAETAPDALAYRFLADGETDEVLLSWSELLRGAQGTAAALTERRTENQPVLITAAPGPGFLHALFGAWLAGAIAVPAYPPRGSRQRARLEAIRSDCGATLCLGEIPNRPLEGLDFLDPATLAASGATVSPVARDDTPCLLQYTSGSTASPKGVVLRHDHLSHHLDAFARHSAEAEIGSLLSWLPPYHDMGLVLKILFGLHSGIPLTWFSPDHFSQRPLRWLKAIHRYRAAMSGAPNFAYDWCLRAVSDEDLPQLDLSCWRFAPTGAERVRLDTLRRFAKRFEPCGFDPRAFRPGYGLAEATLIVTAHPPVTNYGWRTSEKDPSQVSCGRPLDDTRLRIVDPETRAEVPAGETGEIEVASPAVAAGYWQRPEATAAAFADGWLRTGDRGFLENGHLYIIGRIKDLIILDGANVAPEDLETTAAAVEPRLTAVAAFSMETPAGEAIALAAEVRDLGNEDSAHFCAQVRAGVSQRAGMPVRRMLLVRPGLLPRTTSGKIQRHAVREAMDEGRLPLIFDDDGTTAAVPEDAESALDSLLTAIHRATGREGAQPWDDLATFGISSIEATRIAAFVQQATGVELDHADLFNAAHFGALAAEIGRRQPGAAIEITPGSGLASGLVSHSQERMSFLHRLDPDSAAYHVFGALELTGPLDRNALENAYLRVVAAHPILRSRHDDSGMHLADSPPPGIEILAGDADPVLREFARRPFDLAHGAPVRACLVARDPEAHVFGLCAHHIVIDGWSIRVIVAQLAANYEAYRSGKEPPPLPAGPDFIDYAAWQRKRIDEGAADDQIDYWKHRLQGHPGKLGIATDFTRPPRSSSHGGAVIMDLPADLETAIARLARDRRVTPFMIRLAAWILTLRAHGGGDDIVSAVPVANRHHAIAGDLVGTLVNTLPVRVTLGESDRFLDLLDRVRDAALGMQANQEAPFEKIIEAVQPERSRDRAPIAQVMFDHQELPMPESWAGGLAVTPHLLHRGAVQFDLALISFRLPDRTQLILEYRSDLFREATARAMLERFVALLRAACETPETDLRQLDALSDTDRRQLDRFARGPQRPDFRKKTTPALIAESITRFPDATAFTTPAGDLSYAGLDRRSDALAGSLRKLGIAPGDRVAVMLDRTPDLPCALLAIWKCGAAYVPLDPANPAERLALILDDQAPILVLVSPGYTDHLPADRDPVELTDALFQATPQENVVVSADDAAYILYTSGSTGRPKGVVIPHGALANFLLSMAETPGMTAGETLLAVTTVSFDISGLELFLPLVAGGTVDLVDGKTARDAAALRQRCEEAEPDIMQATPATWRMLIDAGWRGSPKLRVLCGGEALDPPLAQKLRPLCHELWNMYGPTETTIWSTIRPVPEKPEAVSIGRPIANTSILILSSGNRPAPPGVPGELLIGGDGLATGYWQRDELTAERFITLAGDRFYRTGDLAKWLPDGNIECLGRTDSQVKVRGFRVELGEIDGALLSHPGVEEAASALVEDRLVGWFRSATGVEPKALADHLRSRLPDYMVPAPLVPLDSFPLTASGKIDRKALATRPLPEVESRDGSVSSDPLVQEFTSLWAEILGLPCVAADDDFFALGGHSLLAARLATAAGERTGLQIPLDWLFDRPTPAGMAARLRIDAATDLARPRAIPLSRHTGGTPLFWVHTLVDGGMGLLPYRETARMLGDITDSYGIAEGTKTFTTLSELAAAHVQSIRSVQPHGPYRLAGFCFGGNVAAEIAWQLAEAGESIELLALLESSPPGFGGRSRWWLRGSNWRRIFQRLPDRLRSLLRRDPASMMRRLKMKQRAASSGVERLVLRDTSIPDLRSVLDLDVLDEASQERALRHWEALHHHQPRLPQADRLVLIRAFDEGWLPRDPQLGWKPPIPFEVYTVSGRHEEFLRHHSAREVATVLRGLFSSGIKTPPA